MKKNLRIASAAAAALLAVAPVAASVVTVNADTVPATALKAAATKSPIDASSAAAKTVLVPGEVVLNRKTNTVFSVNLNDTQKASILNQLGLSEKDFDVEAEATVATNPKDVTGTFTQTLALTVTAKKDLAGLPSTSANNLKLDGMNVVTTDSAKLTATANARFASEQGFPVFFTADGKTQVVDGSVFPVKDELSNGFSAKTLLDLVDKKLDWFTSASKQKEATLVTTENDVEAQLVNQGLKRLSNGDFDYPANGFNLTLTAKSDNGNKTTITVRVNSTVNYNAPVFVVSTLKDGKHVDNNVYRNGDTVRGLKSANVKLNGSLDQDALKKELVAYIQSADNSAVNGYDATADAVDANQVKLAGYTVDTTALNTAQKGLYLVPVTATNPAGLTTKVYVQVVVGDATAPQMYVANDGVKVYNINGYVVTESTKTLTKGQAVDTYGKATVGGVEYTRISKDNSEWVKSSDLSATAPVTETTTTKTINHVAKIYDKDGKATSEKSLHAYDSVSVVSTPVTIMGSKYYKLAGKDQYVKVGNIDGTSRTLSHNSYVYKNTGKASTVKSGKKTVKKLLKKGASVTTYGSAFNINGHKMYRIGKNQYVKVANF